MREFFSAQMLMVYLICTGIGALIGWAVGSPIGGAIIGLLVPLVFVAGMVVMGLVFIEGLMRLFGGRGRR